MSITAQCHCGKRITVSAALAGKTITCPACGNSVDVIPTQVAANVSGKAAPPKSQSPALLMGQMPFGKTLGPRRQDDTPRFYISKGKVVFLSVLAVIALIVFLFIIGPVRVLEQWKAKESQVNANVSDVVTFGLQAYLSQRGMYNPNFQHHVPAVDGPCSFFEPILCFTMPKKIVFRGKTTQGDFMGTYDMRMGDVVADVDYGGYTVGGMVNVARPTGQFRMTGRMSNGAPQAEVDGTSLYIVTPPPEQP